MKVEKGQAAPEIGGLWLILAFPSNRCVNHQS